MSVLGLLFFVAYISPVACIANKFGASLSQYADDTQLHVALSKKVINDAVTNLQNSLFDVHTWFCQNGLVINPEKSELAFLSAIRHARVSYIHETCRAYSHCTYFINCTGFRSTTVSTTRLRHWRIKYGQREVQYTYFHQSVTMLHPETYGLFHNTCSMCPPSRRR